MTDPDSDYNSSEDEDYVPEEGVEDVDYPSGGEVDEVSEADGEVVVTKRKRAGKDNLPNSTQKSSTSADGDVEEDAKAAFLALMSEDDPILGRKRADILPDSLSTSNASTCVNVVASSSSSSSDPEHHELKAESKVITEVFDFAGDEVKVQRTVTAEEAKEIEAREKRKENEKMKKPPQKRLGLGGALTLLAKKPKMSVLDKSNLDWNSFKEENNLKEELETFNRGKNGYLDKMNFLSRSDYREFEKEKAVRNSSRKPT
ncbi:hypothetical protein RB195_006069 [Necator americanus]|uniref:Bucentaur or craniofacial development n=2 Tax=Necator americanus TaxID=51031 RepID=W2TJX7_NECAM|nr:bucentaur or craniofacial development [Necator americanus]ETN81282.1 bucentaur or craniofacial development [Necator americanus]